jgi:hypothetical protein
MTDLGVHCDREDRCSGPGEMDARELTWVAPASCRGAWRLRAHQPWGLVDLRGCDPKHPKEFQ